MARIVLTNAKVTINSVNLSDHIASVTLSTSADVVETTGFHQPQPELALLVCKIIL